MPPAVAHRESTRPWQLVAALGCGALFWVLAVTSIAEKGPVYDEVGHLAAGLAIWQLDDFRLQPENGNLAMRIGALGALLADVPFPERHGELAAAWERSDVWALGDELLHGGGRDPRSLLFGGRAAIAVLGAWLVVLVALWAARLFGPWAGLLSGLLAANCPTLLAHGRLVTSDMAAAALLLAATGAVWTVLHRVTPATVLGGGLVSGALVLAKFSGLLIVPVAALLVVVRIAAGRPLEVVWRGRRTRLEGRARQMGPLLAAGAVHAALVVLVVWAAFAFRFSAFTEEPGPETTFYFGGWSHIEAEPSPVVDAALLAREHHLLPEAFLYGLAFVDVHARHRSAFLDGEYRDSGFRSFFPRAFLYKTPPALLATLLAAAAWAVLARRRPDGRSAPSPAGHGPTAPAPHPDLDGSTIYRLVPLLAVVVVVWGFALTSALNIGHRHLLGSYPPLLVLAGGLLATPRAVAGRERRAASASSASASASASSASASASASSASSASSAAAPAAAAARAAGRAARPSRPRLVLAGALLAWLLVDSLSVRPHYLAYFSPLVGGPEQGWRHLVDSSLDWGQDLPGLARWLSEHVDGDTRVYLSYFGKGDPALAGIDARHLPFEPPNKRRAEPFVLRGGVYCISATMLDHVYTSTKVPWRSSLEREYQERLAEVQRFERLSAEGRGEQLLAERTPEEWGALVTRYDQLRFARLCAALRQREPDAHVGHSILIYRLDDDDVHAALYGEPAELVDDG